MKILKKSHFLSLPIHDILRGATTTNRWHQDQTSQGVEDEPGNLPDHNPIENFRNLMMNLQQNDGATSIAGLRKIAGMVQRQVTLDYLKKLYKPMARRMEAVIQAQGGHKILICLN